MSISLLYTFISYMINIYMITNYHDVCYRPQTKLRKGNVFTSVCQEFSPQGGCLPDTHPSPGRYLLDRRPQAETPGQTPLGRHPHGQTPQTGRHPPFRGRHPSHQQTATAADGMHPTGMHSCVFLILLLLVHVMTTGYVSVNLIQRIQIELRSTKK